MKFLNISTLDSTVKAEENLAGTGESAPLTPIEARLAEVWREVLKVGMIGRTDDFFTLGGNSLQAAQMFAEIEKRFGVKLPLSLLLQISTLEALASVIQGEERPSPPAFVRALVPIQHRGKRPPFFCVHGIGGGVIGYAGLAQRLGEDQPFYGLEAQPDDAADPSLDRMETMAARYIEAIQFIQREGPYYLGGYSYGGMVAFEMACQLRSQGHAVGLLAMLDTAAPKSDYMTPRLNWTFVRGFVENVAYWWTDFWQISSGERMGRIRRKLFIRNPTPKNGEVDLARFVDDVNRVPEGYRELMRKHYAAYETYQPKPYDGRVAVFCTRRQPLFCSYDPHLGWDQWVKGGVDMYRVAGFHRNLLQEPYVPVLASALQDALTRAQASAS